MASVIKNKNGRDGWIISYYDFYGNRKRKVVKCTKKQAELIALEIESKKSRVLLGLDSEVGQDMLFPEAVKFYISRTVKSERTRSRERCVYKPFSAFVGIKCIRQINQKMMIEYFRHRKENDGLTDAGLGIEYRTLRAFFNFFVENNHLTQSPMKGLKNPRVKDKPIRFLSIEEINRLLKVINDPNDRDLILMYIHTGARCLELEKQEFTWQSVYFEERKIVLHGKGDKYRTIPMNDIVFEILYRRKMSEKRDTPFSFNYDPMYRKIKKYYKLAGIEDANIHTLRKTFGSLLVQQNVNIYIVSKLMGHSSVLVTEKHYASLLDENLRNGVQELSKLDF
jgi:integrase